jgi:UDP-N-acetyl-D-glucosamine dehydrogenase
MEDQTGAVAALFDRLGRRQAGVGIIGLGYVGLPLALALAEAGMTVFGFDVDRGKIEKLGRGQTYIKSVTSDHIAERVASGLFRPMADFAGLADVDVIVICVPTPLTRHCEPDLSFVISTAETIGAFLRAGQLVILESTTYPTTTRDVVRPILEKSGLVAERDFYLAYSPEREDPGNQTYSTARIPKVVGGLSPLSRALAKALYESFVVAVVEVSSAETAEAVKLTENIFRAVNIALVNELKVIYSAMGIDVWEVIDAAKTKPFGFMPFYPGPGLGGHCIPIDPFYLTWKAREFGIATRFIELAGQINTAMPDYVVNELALRLDSAQQRGLRGARILLVGLAYKRNVDDVRESPALRLMLRLEQRGAVVRYFDPYIPSIPVTREYAAFAGRRSIAWDAGAIAAFDAVLIATDHDSVDYATLAANARLVVDTRNACGRAGIRAAHIFAA